jgi:hypothetical protein
LWRKILIIKKFSPLILLILIAFSVQIRSQSYLGLNDTYAAILSERGLTYDAWSMSMGNAYSAFGKSYSATLFNPATLATAEKLTVTTSVGLNLHRNTSNYLSTETSANKTQTNFSQLGLVYPMKSDSNSRTFALSFGYNQSKSFNRILKFEGFNQTGSFANELTKSGKELSRGLLLSYPYYDPNSGEYIEDRTILQNNLYQNGSLINEGGIYNWSAGAAYEFAHNVFFGASVNYSIGTLQSNREIIETDINDLYPAGVNTIPGADLTAGFDSYYLNDVVEWSVNGWDGRFGLLYKFFDFIALGGSVKLPTTFVIKEDHYFNGQTNFASGYIKALSEPVVSSEYKITTPFEFTAAASVNLFFVTAAAEISYTDYTQMRFDGEIDPPVTAALNKTIIEKYTQVFNLRGGAEFRLPFTGLSARAGFMYNPSPLASAPSDYARKVINAGLGISSGEGDFEFHITYSRNWWDEPSENFGPTAPRIDQEVKIDNIMTSFTLRFN